MAFNDKGANSKENTPDKDILFATRNLDIFFFPTRERNQPLFVVNLEVKIRIAFEVRKNFFFQRQLFEAGKNLEAVLRRK